MSKYTIVNNEIVPAAAASVLITDLAIQRGYGIFDFFKTIDGAFKFLEDHLDRFFHSAAAMHLPVAQTREELKALLYTLQKKNNMPDSGMRITLTGGYSTDGYTLTKPNMIITQNPLINPEFNKKGIKLITYPHLRQLSQVKTLDYLMAIYLQPLLKEKGADDVLYVHQGLVKECPRANFFIVTADNRLITSEKDVLKGVVRKQLLKLSSSELKISAQDITVHDLKQCKEAFICSTTKNVLPVTEIDGRMIGKGYAGDITEALAEKYKEHLFAGVC